MFTNCHTHIFHSNDSEIVQGELNAEISFYHSLGIHPWNAGEYSCEKAIELLENSITEKTLAIGECGLDGLKGPDMLVQIKLFEAQVIYAEKIEMPLIIHCVKSWNELQAIRKRIQPKQAWVFHSFAKLGILSQVIDAGMMVSLGAGMLTHPKAEEIVRLIPNESLLLETDDQTIEIKQVYERVADLKKISLQELNELVTTNFKNTFRKWQIG